MAPRTIPARIVSLLCLLAILLVALPCANASTHHAMPMVKCDTCCPTEFSATPACCTGTPHPAAAIPQQLQAFTLDRQRLPLVQQTIPATPIVLLSTIHNNSPPPLHPILRI